MAAALRALAARVDITPPGSWTMGGYGARRTRSSGVHEPLEANTVVLRDADSGAGLTWVAIDGLAIVPELREAIVAALQREAGVPPEQVIVVASHTHAAPDAWTGTVHPSLPARLDPAECDRVARLIAQSLTGRGPAVEVSASWGAGAVAGVGANRHRIDGPSDPSLGVLSLHSGDLEAVVFDYACHATVLGPDNSLLSPDWVGGARAELRDRFGEDLPVLYLPGAAGDVSTRFMRRAQSPEEAERLGRIVGGAVLATMDRATGIADPTVEVRRSQFEARLRTSFDDIAYDEDSRSEMRKNGSIQRLVASRAEGDRSRAAFESAGLPARRTVGAALARIGDRAWLHTPFELGSVLGARTTAGAPSTRAIGYSDDYAGYLVDRESARSGQYEALSSFFDLAETDRLVDWLAGVAARHEDTRQPSCQEPPSR